MQHMPTTEIGSLSLYLKSDEKDAALWRWEGKRKIKNVMDAEKIQFLFRLAAYTFPVSFPPSVTSFFLSIGVFPALAHLKVYYMSSYRARTAPQMRRGEAQQHPTRPLSIQGGELWVPGEIRSLDMKHFFERIYAENLIA